MTPRSLFLIIFKTFGLFFIKDTIESFLQVISSLHYMIAGNTSDNIVLALEFYLLYFIFYFIIAYYMVIKTDLLINKLGLEKSFTEEQFSFDFDMKRLLVIVLVIIAGVMLINELPNFLRQLYLYYQRKQYKYEGLADFSVCLVSGCKAVIALLLIGERTAIANFIMKRREGKKE